MPFCMRKVYIWSLIGKEKWQICQIKPVWNTFKSCYIFDDLLWTFEIQVMKIFVMQFHEIVDLSTWRLVSIWIEKTTKFIINCVFFPLQIERIKILWTINEIISYNFKNPLRKYRSQNNSFLQFGKNRINNYDIFSTSITISLLP